MYPFKFVINGVPLPKSQHYFTAKKAIIHTYVFDRSLDSAQEKVIAYIKTLHWVPLYIQQAIKLSNKQMSDLSKDEELLFQEAFVKGITSNFHIIPIRDKSQNLSR